MEEETPPQTGHDTSTETQPIGSGRSVALHAEEKPPQEVVVNPNKSGNMRVTKAGVTWLHEHGYSALINDLIMREDYWEVPKDPNKVSRDHEGLVGVAKANEETEEWQDALTSLTEVIEVPADVEWRVANIAEYGREYVEEEHRVWGIQSRFV